MNYLSFIEDHKSKLGSPQGLYISKILEVEKHFQLKLPNAYKEFLLYFGEASGNLLNGYYMTYPNFIDNKNGAIEMLHFNDRKSESESEKPKINEYHFFFGQWQGYSFFFFECGVNENPPVKLLNDSLEIIEYKKIIY